MEKRLFEEVERTAAISPCERYRYALGRHWEREKGFALFIMLNPSTADALKDDPTIRRCMGFAQSWGYGGIEVCNLFDWRATKPEQLRKSIAFAISDKCDPTIRCRLGEAKAVIAAWGNVPWAEQRIVHVFHTLFREDKRWDCLGMTKHGYPRHPLYVPAVTKPELFW